MCTALELKQHYDEQVKELVGGHQRELSQIRSDHKVELDRMQKALDVVSYQHVRLLFSTNHPQFDAHAFLCFSISFNDKFNEDFLGESSIKISWEFTINFATKCKIAIV